MVQVASLFVVYVLYILFQHQGIIVMSILNILILEDNAGELIKMYLDRRGYKCYTAKTLIGAHLVLDQEKIDLALVDVQLSGGDLGTDILPELKERDIPAIIVTAFDEADVLRKQSAGYLAKPFDFEKLLHLLKDIENGRRK